MTLPGRQRRDSRDTAKLEEAPQSYLESFDRRLAGGFM